MGKHLKRLAAPKAWAVPRKISTWIAKPRCGPHALERSVPLLLVLRDFLKYSDTRKEAKRIIAKGEILVDSKKVKDYKRPVGLMDVISIPKTKEYFRVLLDSKGKLRLVKVSEESATWKLVRIENKHTVRGGKTQLSLHDGRNIILAKPLYKTGDSLKISLPGQKILDHYPLEKDNTCLVIKGKHSGKLAKIEAYEVVKSPQPNLVRFEDFSTIKDNLFVIGREQPEITLPEVSVIE